MNYTDLRPQLVRVPQQVRLVLVALAIPVDPVLRQVLLHLAVREVLLLLYFPEVRAVLVHQYLQMVQAVQKVQGLPYFLRRQDRHICKIVTIVTIAIQLRC